MKEGDVVIVSTGQAGTVLWSIENGETLVLLRNNNLWLGPTAACRHPQSPEDLTQCPVNVERPNPKRKKRNHE